MEKLNRNILLTALMIVSTHIMAQAPVKYNRCPIDLNMPTNFSSVHWDKTCTTLFVAPALKNKISVDQVFMNTSDDECQIIDGINDNYKAKRKFLENKLVYAKSSAYKRDIKRLKEETEKREILDNELQYYLTINEQITSKVSEIKEELTQKTLELQALDPNNIDYMLIEMEINKINKDLLKWEQKESKTRYQVKLTQSLLKSALKSIKVIGQEIFDNQKNDERTYSQIKEILEIQAKDSTIAQFMKEKGADVSIVLESKTPELVNMFRILNPQVLSVQALPVNSKLKFTSNILTENILEAYIDGANYIENKDGARYGQYEIPFSNTIVAKVYVDKYTACTKGKYTLESDIGAVVNANMYYDYNLMINSHYELTYNLSEVFRKIKKNTKKNGIFKSSNSTKLIQDLKKSESFKFKFYSDDESLEIREKRKNEIIGSFVDKALKSVGVSYVSHQTGQGLKLPGQIQAGASQAAGMLREGCANEYCQYAALALDIGHALFGGSEQSNEFISTQNFNVSEIYNESAARKHFGSGGFVQW